MFQLIGVQGRHRGSAWEVGEDGLLVGRSAGCHILVDDRTVSRRHCRIYSENDEIRFEDLGSRNPALLNGIPCEKGTLKPGDELGIGEEVFLLSRGTPPKREAAEVRTPPKTRRVSRSALEHDSGVENPPREDRPRTVHDLAMLFEATRAFSACRSVSDLMEDLRQQISATFAPDKFWFARVRESEHLTFHISPPGIGTQRAAEPPRESFSSALRENRAIIATDPIKVEGQDETRTTLVVPVAFGDTVLGAMALQAESPRRTYRDSDLTLLEHLAQSLAPFIHAVENIEQLRRDNERLRTRAGESLYLVGESRGMGRVRAAITEAAKSGLNALITGETGTGKELAARMLHAQSSRCEGPLIVVNCAAIPKDLFESVLFGYEKGAFTGAQDASPGLLAQAHGGTLFLDEVGDLCLDNQARILRAIEYGTFRRIGAKEESHADIRVISATNSDIPDAIAQGVFRDDLYHRLNAFEIRIPPLRERPSDIPVLANHFFEMAKGQAKRPLSGISPDTLEFLRGCSFPGNVRELRNCVLRAIAVARDAILERQDFMLTSDSGDSSRVKSLEEIEKRHILTILDTCRGNVRDAANLLQIGRSTLYKKLLDYGINVGV